MEKLNFFTLCGAIILFFLPWTTRAMQRPPCCDSERGAIDIRGRESLRANFVERQTRGRIRMKRRMLILAMRCWWVWRLLRQSAGQSSPLSLLFKGIDRPRRNPACSPQRRWFLS